MAGNVVNLNRFRKKKARAEKAKQAEMNRLRHGRTQAQKDGERAAQERAARLLEGKRLETTPAATPNADADADATPDADADADADAEIGDADASANVDE